MAAEQVRRWRLRGISPRSLGGPVHVEGPLIRIGVNEQVLSVSDAAWHVDRLRGDAPPGVFSNDAWHAALDAVAERLDLDGEGN